MSNVKTQEPSLQFIINTLKDRSGNMNYYELQKRLTRTEHTYYDANFLADRLQQLELVEYEKLQHIKLTQKGWDFSTFNDQRLKDFENNEIETLNIENLKLQNESLKHQNSATEKQSEIDNLTIENLKLQNKQIKYYLLYSIVAFIAGAILTNISSIIKFIKSLF